MFFQSITRYRSFGNQVAMILALGTFAWCTGQGTDIIDSIFRSVLVYLAVSIMSLAITNFVLKAYHEMEQEAQRKRREVESADRELPNIEAEMQTGESD